MSHYVCVKATSFIKLRFSTLLCYLTDAAKRIARIIRGHALVNVRSTIRIQLLSSEMLSANHNFPRSNRYSESCLQYGCACVCPYTLGIRCIICEFTSTLSARRSDESVSTHTNVEKLIISFCRSQALDCAMSMAVSSRLKR